MDRLSLRCNKYQKPIDSARFFLLLSLKNTWRYLTFQVFRPLFRIWKDFNSLLFPIGDDLVKDRGTGRSFRHGQCILW